MIIVHIVEKNLVNEISSFSIWFKALSIVIGLGTYALISTYFYYNPNLLHKKSKKLATEKKEFLVISHRGGAAENTENTIEAFHQ